MRPISILTLAALLALPGGESPGGDLRLSVSLFGSLTTSSKLFPNPTARDEIVRGSFSPIDAVAGFGADVRGDLFASGPRLGLSVEYLAGGSGSNVPNAPTRIPIEDGYRAVPIELTAYFDIPVGGDRLDFTMGGGAGVAFGERRYRYAGVDAVTLDRRLVPGIHVLTGLEVLLGDDFSLRTELKFRSLQIETLQRFPATAAVYEGTAVPLPRGDLRSRIQVDGMHLSLGFAWRLP